jgi:DNA-binding response OmpR family regulator
MKILVAEDEHQIRMGLCKNLKFEGYEVDEAKDGEESFTKILKNKYDLIILDIMMPKLSGFDVCRKVRESGNVVPIIMLTAKGEEIDKILGLELGADDYITKPFSLRELLTRIKVILRRCTTNEKSDKSEQIKIGKLIVNFDACTAYSLDGKKIPMTYREMEILKYLWNHKGQTIGRDELLDDVWGANEIVTPRTIDNFISRLRSKIEKNPSFPDHIITFYKVGYKLVI